MINKKYKKNFGFSAIELVFYVALFSALSLVVIDSIIVMTKGFRETTINSDLVQGSNIMERIVRDIRKSSVANIVSSTDLELTNDIVGSLNIEYILDGTDLQLWEDGSFVGNLNIPNLLISNLSFTEIVTTQGQAIRVSFTVATNRYGSNRTEDFSSTVVLRRSYY